MGGTGPGVLRLNRTAPPLLWIPIAIAVVIQVGLLLTVEPEIAFDSASYMAQAESIASTGAARNALGEPDTVRTPGYPLFLAAFLAIGAGYSGVIAAQHFLWIVIVAATTFIGYRVTASRTAAVAAGVITAIDLPALQGTTAILTETWATVFVCAAAWQAYNATRSERVGTAALAGLLAGAAALVRPVALFLGAALALAIYVAAPRPLRTRAAAALLAASLLIPAAWVARNYLQTGVATFSSISSINLLMYRAAGTLAMRDPGGVDANLQHRQEELEAIACRAAEARFQRDCATIPIALRATMYPRLALPILAADPVGVVMQAGRAFVMIVFGGGANMLARLTGISEAAARMIALIYTVPLALLALNGISFWRRIDRAALAVMLLVIAYLVVMSLGVEAYSRFRVPFLPLYALLAGGGAAAVTQRSR